MQISLASSRRCFLRKRSLHLGDYVYNPTEYAIRTGSQGENSPANPEERSSSISGGGLEWARRRHRDEGVWPHGWRLLQTFPQQRRASRRSHRSGLFRVWRKSLSGIGKRSPRRALERSCPAVPESGTL